MKPSRSPVLATKLLERLVSGPYRDALAGDLLEQYQQGRSKVWYWRQVLLGALVGAAKDVRSHKLLATRAVAVGLAIYLLISNPVNWLVHILAMHGTRMIFVLPIADLLADLACLVTGWIAFRLHRAYPLMTVCIYGASVLLFEAGHMGLGLLLDGGAAPNDFPKASLQRVPFDPAPDVHRDWGNRRGDHQQASIRER